MRQQRVVIHLFRNKEKEVVFHVVQACGRFIPFPGNPFEWRYQNRPNSYFLSGEGCVGFNASSLKSVKDVVRYARLAYGVNKRETVTLIGQFDKEIKY